MDSSIPQFALSVRQPWAWYILHAGKDIENRSWGTRMRGPIALHASSGLTRAEFADCLETTVHAISERRPFPPGSTLPAIEELPRGGIVGVVEIVDSVQHSDSPWFFGKHGFRLANPRPDEFVPVKGALGFFDWRKNLEGRR